METTTASRAGAGRANAAKTGKKIATAKDQLSKEKVALRLCDGLPAAIVNMRVIAKREEG